MKQYRPVLITSLILFLAVNTGYYWYGMLGIWNMLLFALYALVFLILSICVIRYLYFIVKERFKNRSRVYAVIIVLFVLVTAITKPNGLIDFERFESKAVLIAWREGVASCTFTLKLKENKEFYYRSICFGDTKIGGHYSVINDTIRFKFDSRISEEKTYEFGIYKPANKIHDKIIGELLLYTSKKDTMPYPLAVYQNTLMK